jgi:hypothetical protein
MPLTEAGQDSVAAEVVLLSPGSANEYVAEAARFCQDWGFTVYFYIGKEFPTQLFSELKNPHLRGCKYLFYIGSRVPGAKEYEPWWCRDAVEWMKERNPQARLIGYEICTRETESPDSIADDVDYREVCSIGDIDLFLALDLRRTR